MITCPKCGKDNQDHYKFCLGCGAELPRDAAPKPFSPQTPPHGMKAQTGAVAARPAAGAPAAPVAAPAAASRGAAAPVQAAAAAPPPAAAAATVICPQCGHVNGPTNLFCGSCGFRLSGQSARPATAPAPSVDGAGAPLLTALRADGSEAGQFRLPPGTVTVGRDTGGIFAGDSYLSPRHATFSQPGPGKLSVKDEGSLNGVYKKLARDVPVPLEPNDIFRIGQEIVRFESLTPLAESPDGVERLGAPSKGYIGRIALVIGRDTTGNAFPVPEAGVQLGRERGDILFPEDGYVSGLHCRLVYEQGQITLIDLGSSNGTFIRLRDEAELQSGDVLLMGQQLFRITL